MRSGGVALVALFLCFGCGDSGNGDASSCPTGFAGDACTSCYPGYHADGAGGCVLDTSCLSSSCSGQGVCSDGGGVVTCACQTGYAGDSCAACADGFHRGADDACVADESCASAACGHGTCDDGGGVVQCTCDAGYAGAACDACAAGFHDDGGACVLDQQCLSTTCAGHGTCTTTQGVVACACDDAYDGDFCETCTAGFHRELGTGDCVVDESCATADPCQFGTCVDSTGEVACSCAAGYAGETCNICAEGFHADLGGACVANDVCAVDTCGGHGSCSDASGVTSCTCDALYAGESCASCTSAADLCGSNCVAATVDQACSAEGTYGGGAQLGQSFIPSRTARLASVAVDADFTGPTAFTVFQGPGSYNNVAAVYATTIDVAAGPRTYELPGGPVLTSGQVYTFYVKRAAGVSFRVVFSDAYAGGALWSSATGYFDWDMVFATSSTSCP
jgi:hypothetical protein